MREYLYLLATDREKGPVADFLKIILYLLSLIYGLIVRILIFIQSNKASHLNCKVISVGNITLGGTGKTPLVEMICRILKQQGKRIAILTRGYKRRDLAAADEPAMLRRNLPGTAVIVDEDRVRAAAKASEDYGVNTVVLDDGFQQWKIKKDLDIVAIDVTNPFGNLRLLPRGILREPLSSLKRASVLVLTKANLTSSNQEIKQLLGKINSQASIFEAIHKPVAFYQLNTSDEKSLSLDKFQGRGVGLVCGIADPASFENIISKLGAKIELSYKFPDHYEYRREDLDRIEAGARQNGVNTIITTEKDSIRFSRLEYRFSGIDYYVLRIELKIIQHEEFAAKILSLY